MNRALRFAALSSCLASIHCGGSTTNGGTPSDGGIPLGDGALPGVPDAHVPTPATCPTTRGAGLNADAGIGDAGFPGECTRDSDCTAGTNGRCLPPQHNGIAHMCSYDECSTDDQCGAGKTCLCGSSLGTFGSDGTPMRTGNTCLPGNCRSDTDCGPGGYCSPTYDTTCGPYDGIQGFYCHTPQDECTSDDQCKDGGGVGFGYCAYDLEMGKWVCEHRICAG